jgi:Domain of unknown function (DUF5979)
MNGRGVTTTGVIDMGDLPGTTGQDGRDRGRGVRLAGLLVVIVGMGFGAASMASASTLLPRQVSGLGELLRSTASDPRATFVDGNAVLCSNANVGFPDSIQVGAVRNNSAGDGNVTGTPGPNTGPIHTGQGEELNVTINGTGVVIDAVVVKGGDGYNVYSDPAVLPPALASPQHYISPFTGGGNVPALSHWFVCYHLATPPPPGSLTVRKTVVVPDFPPATPPPTTFTALVNCNDGEHTNISVTFGEGGGGATGDTITDIQPGTVCTVVEQNVGTFPPGSSVVYLPIGADTAGVTIDADAAVTVTIRNIFSDLTPQSGNLRLVKTVVPAPAGVTMPASYSAHVSCDDGTETDVTLPGAGGEGAPLVNVAAGALCAVGEDIAPLPPGWVVTYSVDGGAPGSSPPVFNVAANQTVTVTITNDATAVAAVTTAPPITPTPTPTGPVAGGSTVAPTMPDTLPPTGGDPAIPVTFGVLLVVVGSLAIIQTTRRRRPSDDQTTG